MRPVQAGPALRHLRNGDRELAPDGNLPKQRLHRRGFRNSRVREGAQVILYGRKIARHVRVSQRDYHRPRGRRFHDPLLQRWLHRIRIPTLILWGEDDRIFPPAYGESWAKAIAGARLVVLPRCGHLPIQERPEDFAATVVEFCGAVRAGDGA